MLGGAPTAVLGVAGVREILIGMLVLNLRSPWGPVRLGGRHLILS